MDHQNMINQTTYALVEARSSTKSGQPAGYQPVAIKLKLRYYEHICESQPIAIIRLYMKLSQAYMHEYKSKENGAYICDSATYICR